MVNPGVKERYERFRDWEADQESDQCERKGATEAQIQGLVAFAGVPLPEDYLEFVRFSDGFLDFFSVEDVIVSTHLFRVHETGSLVIGSDGSEGLLVLDLRTSAIMPYAYLPDERHQWEYVSGTWPDFKTLFLAITPLNLI